MLLYRDLSPIPRPIHDNELLNQDETGLSTDDMSDAPEQYERRHRSPPIPDNLSDYINDEQRISLEQIKQHGWQLAFIRRPLFLDPLVVVTNQDQSCYGVLELDGSINTHIVVQFR